MNSEKAFDMLPHAVDIFEKLDVQAYVKNNMVNTSAMTPEQKEKVNNAMGIKLISHLLKNSSKVKEEFFNIVAISCGITLEEAKSQGLGQTIKSIKEVFTDKELMAFFKEAIQ